MTSAAATAADAVRSRPAYAIYVVLVLMVAYMLSFMDRVLISLMIEPIRTELGLGDTQVGLLVGFGFVLLYSIMGIPFGSLADSSNRRNLMVFGVLGWSAATAASGFAGGFASLLAARAMVGIGEATLSPAAYSTIADRFEKKRLGFAVSLYNMGVSLGGGVAMLFGGVLVAWAMKTQIPLPWGELTGWRLAFVAVGLLGAPLAAVMLLTVREAARRRGAAKAPPLSALWALAMRHKAAFGGVVIGYSIIVIAAYGAMLWAPVHFARAHGMSPAHLGLAFGVIIGLFGTVGLGIGGLLSDRAAKRGHAEAPVRIVLAAAIIQFPLMMGAYLVSDTNTALALAAVGMATVSTIGGLQAATLQILTPATMRGRMTAIYLLVANMAGMGLGPLIIGFVSEHLFDGPTSLGKALALVTAVSLSIGIVLLLTTRKAIIAAVQDNDRNEALAAQDAV
ncbi:MULTISPECIES: MFS transporter [unclassified Brevundimonas]|uniref:spinster family MFS transporter n=1 Tax=unclassified Brevundimonas TaxID=2622653 RepID=UPI000CFD61C8|nr:MULTISPECIES: MFS transporter [unclassified Brevundimonas]PRA29145.1 MFS transporter [Brevundimonas sp. MYb27]PQZ84807.1 MFS transporter [Brevundimonas sp. MYb31]PRB14601.1 MFS transporter [Brevundimonas sp. MYb52]PRB36626.1 MFS transporter [Brevundimonas sp. MYb46]PRB55675.1 MFS transporter [Brevundimonas sp. MYb33]